LGAGCWKDPVLKCETVIGGAKFSKTSHKTSTKKVRHEVTQVPRTYERSDVLFCCTYGFKHFKTAKDGKEDCIEPLHCVLRVVGGTSWVSFKMEGAAITNPGNREWCIREDDVALLVQYGGTVIWYMFAAFMCILSFHGMIELVHCVPRMVRGVMDEIDRRAKMLEHALRVVKEAIALVFAVMILLFILSRAVIYGRATGVDKEL
jgi:hypothetical protein